ncbi:MAG: DNRLRE domain-containing protein, partial [Planctomycetota bacterium]
MLDAVEDTFVRGGADADVNFGSSTQLESSAYANGDTVEGRVTYVKFDVDDFDPAGDGWVKFAKLELFGGLDVKLDDPVDYTVFGVSGAWDELTTTWSNQPGYEPFGIDSDDIRRSNPSKHKWNVTNYVRDAVNAGQAHVSFAIVGGAETGVHASFTSREGDADAAPKLTVRSRKAPRDYRTTLVVTDDAHVRGGGKADTNYGTDERLRVERTATGNDSGDYRTLLKYDLAGLDGELLHGLVRIRGDFRPDPGVTGPALVGIFGVDDAWDQGSVTLNTAPPQLSDEPLSVALVGEQRGWTEWDVTEHVRERLAAGDTTLSLEIAGIGVTNGRVVFDSQERPGKKPAEINLLFAEPLAPEVPVDVEVTSVDGYAALTWTPTRVPVDHYRIEVARDGD